MLSETVTFMGNKIQIPHLFLPKNGSTSTLFLIVLKFLRGKMFMAQLTIVTFQKKCHSCYTRYDALHWICSKTSIGRPIRTSQVIRRWLILKHKYFNCVWELYCYRFCTVKWHWIIWAHEVEWYSHSSLTHIEIDKKIHHSMHRL
jgi:hypothetical protein